MTNYLGNHINPFSCPLIFLPLLFVSSSAFTVADAVRIKMTLREETAVGIIEMQVVFG